MFDKKDTQSPPASDDFSAEAEHPLPEPVDILVVEDNENQRTSIVATLKACLSGVEIVAVGNGDEALDFLFGRGNWKNRSGCDPPRLILLDLEMPGTSSFSVLGQIRSMGPQFSLTLAPVVVFTDSTAVGDIQETYRCGANSYVIKPLSYTEFHKVVDSIGRYWIKHNQSPY